jgi:hypothetical protein
LPPDEDRIFDFKSEKPRISCRGVNLAVDFRLENSGKEWARSLYEKYIWNQEVIMDRKPE